MRWQRLPAPLRMVISGDFLGRPGGSGSRAFLSLSLSLLFACAESSKSKPSSGLGVVTTSRILVQRLVLGIAHLLVTRSCPKAPPLPPRHLHGGHPRVEHVHVVSQRGQLVLQHFLAFSRRPLGQDPLRLLHLEQPFELLDLLLLLLDLLVQQLGMPGYLQSHKDAEHDIMKLLNLNNQIWVKYLKQTT